MQAGWFKDRLRELRAQAGLTQQQLADKAGMTREGVAQIETGRREPTWASVVALAVALGVSCDSFLQPPASAASGEDGAAPAEVKRPKGRPRKQEGVTAAEPQEAPAQAPAPAPAATPARKPRRKPRKTSAEPVEEPAPQPVRGRPRKPTTPEEATGPEGPVEPEGSEAQPPSEKAGQEKKRTRKRKEG